MPINSYSDIIKYALSFWGTKSSRDSPPPPAPPKKDPEKLPAVCVINKYYVCTLSLLILYAYASMVDNMSRTSIHNKEHRRNDAGIE